MALDLQEWHAPFFLDENELYHKRKLPHPVEFMDAQVLPILNALTCLLYSNNAYP
jgi:hypothetical protein